jgi:hypothetical protein
MAKHSSGTTDDKSRVKNSAPSAAIATGQGVHVGDDVSLKIAPKLHEPDLTKAGVILEHAIVDYARVQSIFDIPSDQMATMKSAAMAKLRDLPRNKLAGLSASSSLITDAARTGFSAVYGSLSDDQRRVMRMQQMTGQSTGAGIFDARGRIFVDGVTGYVDRDGRKTDSRERLSSADYDKIGNGGTDRGAYKELLGEGFTRPELDSAFNSARLLGWNDRDSIRNLANAGKDFSSAVVEYDQARKKGDKAAIEKADKKIHDAQDKTTDPDKRKAQDEILKKLYAPENDSAPAAQKPTGDRANLFKKLTSPSPH